MLDNKPLTLINSQQYDNTVVSTSDTRLQISTELEVQEPAFYQVVLLNDDYTPIDFVINLLMVVFGKNYQEAYDITMQVHHFNKGSAGIYPYELAIEKMHQANEMAKINEFPLQCITEQL